MPKRTDVHRPGAIVPRDYEFVLHYALSKPHEPSDGVNCELDRRVVDDKGRIIRVGEHDADGRCCVIGLRHVARVSFVATGSTGRCSVCGARFVYGCVWRHIPSGEYLHIGHECAHKYGLVAGREDWNAAIEALKTRRAARLEELRRHERLETFVERFPYMRDVLNHKHEILEDMRGKVRKYGNIGEKQIDFACSLFSRALCPERPNVECPKLPAPTGRIVVEGVVVSRKVYEGGWGSSTKVTVKVTTDAGEWLCWGSCFSAAQVGDRVRFKATLEKGREPHFALFKRPVDLGVQEAA